MKNKSKKFQNETYRVQDIRDWLENNNISHEDFAYKINENYDTIKGYLTGRKKKPDIEILKKMANASGMTLDYFLYNSDVNSYDVETQKLQERMGIDKNIKENLYAYKQYIGISKMDSKPTNISKKDYNDVLDLLSSTKIQTDIGNKTFIELFNSKVLNLLICSIIYDKPFMEIFKNSFNTLSTKINANKTKAIGSNEIDFTFEEILNHLKTEEIYGSTQIKLHNAIDQLLEITLKETFNAIEPRTTLF